ncbi:hemerythrin HHE cation binding domain-containing protein [Coniochaeta sp. 2T2.1]|nr:hemerythrin HHE cation binding domain-containing protein [Coniochaeta sp. 2T2.1]
MAPIYADHPFPFIPTPEAANRAAGTQSDMFDHVASEMAQVHNLMVRGLNAIYLQAPHIKPQDVKPFVNYMTLWLELLHVHHSGEEEEFFPDLERMAGEKGMMEANVEQHHAFHDGLEALHGYVKNVAAGKAEYDGQKVCSMIDAFGTTLNQHLADEVPTIQGLRKYGDKMATLQKRFDDEGEKNMKKIGLGNVTVCLTMHDTNFENGIWKQWPPMPTPIRFLIRNIIWWFVRDTSKFGPCDHKGNLKPLYAVAAQ